MSQQPPQGQGPQQPPQGQGFPQQPPPGQGYQQPAPAPPKKKHTRRNIGIGCGGLLGVVIIIIIIAAATSAGGGGNNGAADAGGNGGNGGSATTGTPAPAATGTPAPGGPKTSFGSGTFLVNQDIAPGTYYSRAGSLCYWERQSGLSGTVDDIIANDNVPSGAQAIVTIASTDASFKSQGCGTWRPQPASGDQKTSFGAGTYQVGVNIAPGQYMAPGGDLCYWERVSGFGGTVDEILANDNPTGQVIVSISSGDAGFMSHGCGQWTMGG